MAQVNNYDWLNCIPEGWEEIGRQMIAECEAIDPSYQIEDLKEKWGELRVYSYIEDYDDIKRKNKIEAVENKYIQQSAKTCCVCGKPATRISTGWICPYCDDCGDKEEKFYKRFKNE